MTSASSATGFRRRATPRSTYLPVLRSLRRRPRDVAVSIPRQLPRTAGREGLFSPTLGQLRGRYRHRASPGICYIGGRGVREGTGDMACSQCISAKFIGNGRHHLPDSAGF